MSSSTPTSQDSSDFSQSKFNLSNRSKCKTLPTKPVRFPESDNNSSTSSRSTQSDGSTVVLRGGLSQRWPRKKWGPKSVPLGFFWDIENCNVPKKHSAAVVVQRIRQFFLKNYWEAEFLVVCDVKKEKPQIIQELHDSQVNLFHVSSTSKNAADEKLRQSLRRFAEIYPAPAAIVLISSDINFAADLSDLRYRKKMRVMLVHHTNVTDALILCANDHYNYFAIVDGLPKEKMKMSKSPSIEPVFLEVSNLPTNKQVGLVKNRLQFLTSNCGGRVLNLEDGIATIQFENQSVANRAQKRIQGENVFGNKIKAGTPNLRNYRGLKVKGDGGLQGHLAMKNLPQDALSGLVGKESRRVSSDSQDFRPISLDSGAMFRRSRTPQEALNSRRHKTSCSSDFSDDLAQLEASKSGHPVDLIISNLDPTISIKDLNWLLTNMFKDYAMILNMNVSAQMDGTPIANLRVNNQQAAQYVISQLHRQKLGHKRIVISYANSNSPDLEHLKAMVINILQEAPDNQMPLFKLIELLESRYLCTVSISDVNKLKDICKITEVSGSRIISFTSQYKASPPPNLTKTLLPYCTTHCADGLPNLGWCELNTIQTPNIMMQLKQFASKLNGLLDCHLGSMPLLSFQACYEQEYQEPLPVNFSGVPLEHLVTCVSNIEIKCLGPNKSIKIIKQEMKSVELDEGAVLKTVPLSLASHISLLCRELVDLLKTSDRCQLLMSKFIPAYHHHFGRQCHVADYGYTKLIDLFESIPHVIQIMGEGTRKIITLSHQAQMRRFTSDLLRVLKVQPSKQIYLKDYATAYEKVLNRSFNPVDYGLCTFQDLLEEVPENTIVISNPNDDADDSIDNLLISVPKREQTAKEIMRTKQFAMQVIDLLKHSPYCTMVFNKFVPAYHHHFGHQCRVSDYGFAKLIELFEAIPDVVKIEELPERERTVTLTLHQSLKILGSQLVALVKSSSTLSLPIQELPRIYLKEYGYPLKPQVYECNSVEELVNRVRDYVQVVETNAGSLLIPVNSNFYTIIKIRAWALLLKPPHCKLFPTFQYEYQSHYNSELTLDDLNQLRNVVNLSTLNDSTYIALSDIYVFAAELYHLLCANWGSIPYHSLETLYQQEFGRTVKLSDYNINSIDELYEKFDFLFFICGYKKDILAVNRNLSEYNIALPTQIYNNSGHVGMKKKWPLLPPPPPPPVAVQTHKENLSMKKFSPPKPDTPPSPSTTPWTPRRKSLDADLSLSIQLPIIQNPELLGDPYDLISPAKHLFHSSRSPWAKPPDPSELPMPDKLLLRRLSDESADSGVNSKLENSVASDNETGAAAAAACGGNNRYFLLE